MMYQYVGGSKQFNIKKVQNSLLENLERYLYTTVKGLKWILSLEVLGKSY